MNATLTRDLTRAPGRGSGVARIGARFEGLLWWAAVLVMTPGLILREPWIVALGSALIALAFVASDLRRIGRGGVSAITVYSLSACAIGVSNTIALLSEGGPSERVYFLYTSRDHLFLALLLAAAGTILPVLGFRWATRTPQARALYSWLPPVVGRLTPKQLLRWGTALAAVVVALRLVASLPSLGTLTAVVLMVPQLAAFSIARMATEFRIRGALFVALAIALADAAYALMFLFLRAEVAGPLAAVFLGAVLGDPSFSVLRRRALIPVYAAAALFVVYFGTLGESRNRAGGFERVVAAYELQENLARGDPGAPVARQTVLSRLTTFNQLSQVGRVVEEDGFLDGQTLEYLGFAFIPRFLWPEKPAIAKGAWWALRIGQANIRPDGAISNSVNMTIPGELYLNFGWTGVVAGCLLFGMFVGILWDRARFWDGASNTLGSAYGFYLLWVWIALSLGPDLQMVVTMTALYMVFWAIGVALRWSIVEAPSGAGAGRRGGTPKPVAFP